ncbi:MAG: hypothetical protein K6E21_02305 [Bacilli bacterium]|nr:hypothetical protein [Bacilli bacterium]
MEWIKNNTTTFVFTVLFGLVIIFFLTSTIITYASQHYFNRKKRNKLNTTFGIEVDLKSNRVVYFNRRDFSIHRTISLEAFYALLHNKDTMRIKIWLDELKKNFDFTDRYLETEIVGKSVKGDFLLLKAVAFNEETQRIYIEGNQLNNMNPSQGRKRNSNDDYAVIKRGQIESIYNTLKNRFGYVFSIKFFYRNNDVIHDATVEKSVLYKLKNEIYSFAEEGRNRYVFDEYDEQIYLFDFKIDNDEEATKLAESVFKKMQIYLKLRGFADTHGVSIGAVNLLLASSISEAIVKASQSAESARINELPYVISNGGSENLQAFDNGLVEKIFNNDSLRLLYRPIININTEQIIGYFSNVRVLETNFENYFDIARYINKVDRNQELLSKVIQQFVSKFYFERPSDRTRLFIQISLVDLDHLGIVLSNIAHSSEANLVLMFEESEVNANAFSIDLLSSQLKELIDLGYEIALLLKDENTLLENDFYSVFNYFVIGSAMASKIRDSSRVRLSNKFLIESLLQYKRPIIINDLDGWSSIDLFVKSGCTFLSGDDISPSSEMILPIEKTKIARLRKINN